MIKHYKYRKVIEHDIEIDESNLAELIDYAKLVLQEDYIPLSVENIFEEVFFNSDDGIEIYVDDFLLSINEVEMNYSDDVYNFVYDIIHNYITEYVGKGE